jgi:hypothetical protein
MVRCKMVMLAVAVFLQFTIASAQSGLLQSIDLGDLYRRQQLTGGRFSDHSFSIRPLQAGAFGDSTNKDKALHLSAFAGYTVLNNSKLPYGYNDESLYPAAGLQQRLRMGFRVRSGNLTVQLIPEFVTAANRTPDDLPADFNMSNYWGQFYFYQVNKIDMPTKFGTASLQKVFPGQSFIRYNFGKFSAGVSSENIWWGPGLQNSLVMSNNAPGFIHGTVQTNAPVPTPVGGFEAQVIYGVLNSSGITPPENDRLRPLGICNGCYEPKQDDNRLLTAFVVSWQPKWLKNFYIGLSQASYNYAGGTERAARLGSMFFRYAMPADHAEVYAEYGRSNKAANPFTVFGDTIPTGYLLGVRKFIPLNREKGFIELSAELTHLSLSDASLILDRNNPFGLPNPATNSWYTDQYVRDGYTHQGQVLGAGIGPGGASQTINVNWVKDQNRVGVRFDRVVHNNDFYYYSYYNGNIGGGTSNRYWVDVAWTAYGQWSYKQFMFAGAINYLRALNYKWIKMDNSYADPSPLSDKSNVQVVFSLLYSIDLSSSIVRKGWKTDKKRSEWQRNW